MPKTPGGAVDERQARRHNPLAEEYAPTNPLKQKIPKKRKSVQHQRDDNQYIGSKASRRILRIGQDLVDEDAAERQALEPNPAFALDSRFTSGDVESADIPAFPDEDDAWGDEDGVSDVVEEVELDPSDQDIFNRFHPSAHADPSLLFDPATRESLPDEDDQGTNLADLILAKIAEHEASATGPGAPLSTSRPASPAAGFDNDDTDPELPPKVVEVYTKVGQLLSRHRSGPLPKPFKILPTLPLSQIPLLISLTRPDDWTPHVHFLATRLFISAKPAVAQPYLTAILLPRIRDDIRETKKLHVHLYNALKKALYKPACFFKGLLFPLLEDGTCTLREAHIVASVIARVSVPVLHSAAALLRLCDIAAEQFSTAHAARSADDSGGGTGATNTFIRVLLEKKYALPYKVVDALVFHFLRFKALAAVGHFDEHDTAMSGVERGAAARREATAAKLPVLWHQGLLAFAQRYRNEITEEQREALLDLVNAVGHRQMGPETRRELLQGRGRGVPVEFEADQDGDDTMAMG